VAKLGCLLALGCLALVTSAPAPAAAASPSRDGPALALLQRSVLTAIAATPVAQALKGVEGSLVFLGSRYGRARQAEVAPPPVPTEPPPPTEPGEIPPASAGTNGTPIPPPPPGSGVAGDLTAHAPVLHGARVEGMSATFVSGIVLAPAGVPDRIKGVINAANTIVGRPYAWGGGHGSWYASGYDCSGAVSFALAGGGFLASPLASGQFAGWGEAGRGRWLTVYASPSHAYAVIAGFRWDTVGDANGSGPRWHRAGVPPAGFVARHPPGY
jgi:cell wall-associated NlpC family hydrolase